MLHSKTCSGVLFGFFGWFIWGLGELICKKRVSCKETFFGRSLFAISIGMDKFPL